MDTKKISYLNRLKEMSFEQFEEETKTESYRQISTDPSIKKEFREMRMSRMSAEFRRERLLEALYSSPVVLEWLTEMQSYRDLRSEQAWISIAIRGGENDGATKACWQELDKKRRSVHNKALKAFCKLVEKTSPGCTRDNRSSDSTFFVPRDEKKGDLYDGPLMIPEEEPNKYGDPYVRTEMTNGMFQFLKFIELTHRGDWDRSRASVFERLNLAPDAKVPDIIEIQNNLARMTRGWGMSEPLDKDEFSTDLFDERDNKYRSTRKRGFDSWDDR